MFTSINNRRAFTLIELLVVILIIAILVAVALPNFLGQQHKAQNSASIQNLTVVRHNLKAAWIGGGTGAENAYPAAGNGATQLNGILTESEPQFNFVGATLPANDYTAVSIDRNSPNSVLACQQSKSKVFFCLETNENGASSLTPSTVASVLFAPDSAHAADTTFYSTGSTQADALAALDVIDGNNGTGRLGWDAKVQSTGAQTPTGPDPHGKSKADVTAALTAMETAIKAEANNHGGLLNNASAASVQAAQPSYQYANLTFNAPDSGVFTDGGYINVVNLGSLGVPSYMYACEKSDAPAAYPTVYCTFTQNNGITFTHTVAYSAQHASLYNIDPSYGPSAAEGWDSSPAGNHPIVYTGTNTITGDGSAVGNVLTGHQVTYVGDAGMNVVSYWERGHADWPGGNWTPLEDTLASGTGDSTYTITNDDIGYDFRFATLANYGAPNFNTGVSVKSVFKNGPSNVTAATIAADNAALATVNDYAYKLKTYTDANNLLPATDNYYSGGPGIPVIAEWQLGSTVPVVCGRTGCNPGQQYIDAMNELVGHATTEQVIIEQAQGARQGALLFVNAVGGNVAYRLSVYLGSNDEYVFNLVRQRGGHPQAGGAPGDQILTGSGTNVQVSADPDALWTPVAP